MQLHTRYCINLSMHHSQIRRYSRMMCNRLCIFLSNEMCKMLPYSSYDNSYHMHRFLPNRTLPCNRSIHNFYYIPAYSMQHSHCYMSSLPQRQQYMYLYTSYIHPYNQMYIRSYIQNRTMYCIPIRNYPYRIQCTNSNNRNHTTRCRFLGIHQCNLLYNLMSIHDQFLFYNLLYFPKDYQHIHQNSSWNKNAYMM